jgi:Cu/Zn superoxide dismutase
MRRTAVPLLLASAVVGIAVAGLPSAQAHARPDRFEAELSPVNHSGEGEVRIRQHDGEITVRLRAEGLDDGIHLAHIHGLRQAENECPGMVADTDHNGFVDFLEGVPFYGPVQITLSNGTDDRGDDLRYRRSFTMLDDRSALSTLGDLSQYAIVIHGVDLNGDGIVNDPDVNGDGSPNPPDNEISMPALCGTIEPR